MQFFNDEKSDQLVFGGVPYDPQKMFQSNLGGKGKVALRI